MMDDWFWKRHLGPIDDVPLICIWQRPGENIKKGPKSPWTTIGFGLIGGRKRKVNFKISASPAALPPRHLNHSKCLLWQVGLMPWSEHQTTDDIAGHVLQLPDLQSLIALGYPCTRMSCFPALVTQDESVSRGWAKTLRSVSVLGWQFEPELCGWSTNCLNIYWCPSVMDACQHWWCEQTNSRHY